MDAIDRIRQFNRFYTKRLGLFSRDFAGSGHSIAELRVLYEIGAAEGRTARSIAQDLGLDEGYVSRILKGYERDGWIARTPSDSDARRKALSLTPAGRAAFEDLVERTRAETCKRLNGSDPGLVAEALTRAMDALSEDEGAAQAEIRGLAPGDAGWVVQRHAELYAIEQGFDWRMEALVMDIMAGFLRADASAGNRAFIAHRGAERLGCIFCMASDTPGLAKLRLFLVEPAARGMGLGKRLMAACMDHARSAGFERMTLMTHQSQKTARALYRRHGFSLIESLPGRYFGRDAVQETWEVDL